MNKTETEDRFTVRPAAVRDLPEIYRIECNSFPPAEAASLAKYAWRLEHYPEYFFVGEVNKKTVSVVCVIPTALSVIEDGLFEMEKMPVGKTAAILSVMTDESQRQRGYATLTLRKVIEIMREMGMESACLTCKEHLISYYEKFGFSKLGVSASIHGGAVWYDMTLKL